MSPSARNFRTRIARQNRYTNPLHTASAERRHTFTSAVLDASGGNLLIARDAGGWASAAMVDEVYGHVDVHDPKFDAALRTVWGEAW
jgi:integrase